jgi:hypothetical protein
MLAMNAIMAILGMAAVDGKTTFVTKTHSITLITQLAFITLVQIK